jgi:hypothetical protein
MSKGSREKNSAINTDDYCISKAVLSEEQRSRKSTAGIGIKRNPRAKLRSI